MIGTLTVAHLAARYTDWAHGIYPALDYPELFKLGLTELYRKREREADAAHVEWMREEVVRGLQSLDEGKSSRLSTAEVVQVAEEELVGPAT